MNEVLTQQNLTTADIANPQRKATGAAEANAGNGSVDATSAARSLPAAQDTAAGNDPGHAGQLFPQNELQNFRSQWDQAQGSFVDEPRKAVEQADGLVANVVQRIAEQFAEERARLEKQWARGDDVSTEDLRQALKRYRAFFDRLLSF